MRIKFELSELQAFMAAAEKLNFKAAADALFISQPALSRRIEKLEFAVGARLLDRTTRRVSLTDSGDRFLRNARAAIQVLEGAALEVSQVALQGTDLVTVACIPSAANHLLPSALSEFAKQFPSVRVRIRDENTAEILRHVVDGDADFGLTFIGSQHPDIQFKPIFKERYVIALRRDHRLARRKSLAWADLVHERGIVLGDENSGNRQLLDKALSRIEKKPTMLYEALHMAGVLGMVEAGLGVAAVPSLAISNAPGSPVVAIPVVEPTITRTFGLISRKGKRLKPAAEILCRMLRNLPQ